VQSLGMAVRPVPVRHLSGNPTNRELAKPAETFHAIQTGHCSFAYSALACFMRGMSGDSLRQPHPTQQVGVARIAVQTVVGS
jgi:hypothetical protein